MAVGRGVMGAAFTKRGAAAVGLVSDLARRKSLPSSTSASGPTASVAGTRWRWRWGGALATLLVRADAAPMLAERAADVGLALCRLALRGGANRADNINPRHLH